MIEKLLITEKLSWDNVWEMSVINGERQDHVPHADRLTSSNWTPPIVRSAGSERQVDRVLIFENRLHQSRNTTERVRVRSCRSWATSVHDGFMALRKF